MEDERPNDRHLRPSRHDGRSANRSEKADLFSRETGHHSDHHHRRRCSSADGCLEKQHPCNHVGTAAANVLGSTPPVDHVTDTITPFQDDTFINDPFKFQTAQASDPTATPSIRAACSFGPLQKPNNTRPIILSPSRPIPSLGLKTKPGPLSQSNDVAPLPSSSNINVASSPVKDDSVLLLYPNPSDLISPYPGINLTVLDLVGTSTKAPIPEFPSSASPYMPSNISSQETYVEDTQDRRSHLPAVHGPNHEVNPYASTPIKAKPIQALTPNGTVRILPHTPSPASSNSRRRSLRMLNLEEAPDTATRIENAAKIKSLEAKPTKKRGAKGDPPLGSLQVPVLDITDEEIALLSTATGYRLDAEAAEKISAGRSWDIGATSA